MPITIIDAGGTLTTIDRSSRTFARHLTRGDIIATGEPLVFRLVREIALKKPTRLAHLNKGKKK